MLRIRFSFMNKRLNKIMLESLWRRSLALALCMVMTDSLEQLAMGISAHLASKSCAEKWRKRFHKVHMFMFNTFNIIINSWMSKYTYLNLLILLQYVLDAKLMNWSKQLPVGWIRVPVSPWTLYHVIVGLSTDLCLMDAGLPLIRWWTINSDEK